MKQIKRGINNIVFVTKIIVLISRELFLLLLISNLFAAILPFVNIFFSRLIIDEFIESALKGKLFFYAIEAIGINVALQVILAILGKKIKQVSAYFELQFEKKLSFHLIDLSLENISSNYVKKLQRDIIQGKMRGVQPTAIIPQVDRLLKNIFTLILAIFSVMQVYGFRQNALKSSIWTGTWPLVAILFIMTIIVFISFKLQVKKNIKITELNREANSANGGAFAYMQMISDPHFGKDIRIYQIKDFLCDEFNKLWSSSIGYNLLKKIGHEKAMIPCVTAFCNGIMDLLIYIVIIMKAVAGEISIGAVVLCIGSIRIFTQSIMELVNTIVELMGFGELLEPYFELLNINEEKYKSKMGITDELNILKFEHVSFKYPDSEQWALYDVSFEINNGEHIAIVGVNGSGKSTIVKLICRFFEPQEGKITWNGVDIRHMEVGQYRQNISTVFQDFSLPAFQLGQVIACKDDYDAKEVNDAIQKSGLFEDETWQKRKVEDWLFKQYEGDGIEISGGEAQKVAIVRAFYKKSSILVLDEPTAALDPRTEADIFENIARMESGKTMIYVSHRMSSCKNCQKILVLDNGKIVQCGNHQELVEQAGLYREMWKAQAEFYI